MYLFFKRLPSNINLSLDLFHSSFGERMSFAVWGGLNFSFENPLDSHSEIVNGIPEDVVTVLYTGWNIK